MKCRHPKHIGALLNADVKCARMIYIWTVVTVALLINVVASIALVRSGTFTRRQKRLQAVLVWVVPIVGAITCLYFLTESQHSRAAQSSGDPGYTDSWLAGSDTPPDQHRG